MQKIAIVESLISTRSGFSVFFSFFLHLRPHSRTFFLPLPFEREKRSQNNEMMAELVRLFNAVSPSRSRSWGRECGLGARTRTRALSSL
jgi:hypothetical protein